MAIPQFKANINLPTSRQGDGGASGFNAVANVYNQAANLVGDINEKNTRFLEEEAFKKGLTGEFTEESLPASTSRLGKAAREGFAANQALRVNLNVQQNVNSIVNNPNLTEEEMVTQLEQSAQNMAASSIPELADDIFKSYSTFGNSAISRISKERIVAQKKAQLQGLADIQSELELKYVNAFAANEKATRERQKIMSDLKSGRITQSQFDELSLGINDEAAVDLANVQESLLSTYNQRIGIDDEFSERNAQVSLAQLGRKARNENLAIIALERNDVSFLKDMQDVSIDDKISIMTKWSTQANILNNAEDRAERKADEQLMDVVNQRLIQAENLAGQDPLSARQMVEEIKGLNEQVGSRELQKQLVAVESTIDEIESSGGAGNPIIANKIDRLIRSGEISSVEEAQAYGYSSLNEQERIVVQESIDKTFDERLQSATYLNLRKNISLRLRDDPSSPSFAQQALGQKVTAKQKLIEEKRDEILREMEEGILDGTLVNNQQIRQFYNEMVSQAKRELNPNEIELWNSTGLSIDATEDDIVRYVVKNRGGKDKEYAKLLIEAQKIMKDIK